jgi:hypothetical protein
MKQLLLFASSRSPKYRLILLLIQLPIVLCQTFSAKAEADFGTCYNQIIKKASHDETVFWCNCMIKVESQFSSLKSAGNYCNNALRERSSRESNELIKEMIKRDLMGGSRASPPIRGTDPTCALTRAFGLPCAGDSRMRCRETRDMFGNPVTECAEF